MCDSSGEHWIIFNGEIYNYRTLRADMVTRGHLFRTQSDTEVILQLYRERGERCVESLNGMFAFAIWDSVRRSIFLARDRMGVKPLYYAEAPGAFVFASEVKAVLASGAIPARAREEAFAEYCVFRQVAGPETLFKGVRVLPPGCSLTVTDGEVRVKRYWSPHPPADRPAIRFDDAVHQLGELLEDSVRLRLISDVPVGTFCSGGVDSSLVTAIAAKLKGEPVNTYSVGFDDPAFDESESAIAVARRYRTNHHRLDVSHEDFAELFPKSVWHNDEPLDFANSVHIFALSRLAQRKVTVVLTGEGSDELFAGYPRYRIPDVAQQYGYVPAMVRRFLTGLTGDHRLAKLDRFASNSFDHSLLHNASYLSVDTLHAIAPTLRYASAYREDCLRRGAGLGLDTINRVSLIDQETFLAGILLRQDKMSMAASIESRVPFMDYRIVEFANRLPSSCKLRRGVGKAVVKACARTMLPAAIVNRRKAGFGVPLAAWFRESSGLGELVAALPDHPAADLFDRTRLRTAVAEHRAGRSDHSDLLWTALNLVTWREVFRC